MRLLTNNPAKVRGMQDNGLVVSRRLPLHVGAAPANLRYLDTKQRRMGHFPPSQLDQITAVTPASPSWPLLFAGGR
jgi:hypothetical protein